MKIKNKNNTSKLLNGFIIGTFVLLYVITSLISTIHVIDFFRLSNTEWLAIFIALAFEIGAAASLASIVTLDKMNKGIVWGLFVILTLMQAMGNTYYAYTHLSNFQGWIELFGLAEEELIYQKRILSIVSGAVLPIVALGFIKSLVDYIKPSEKQTLSEVEEKIENIFEEKIDEAIEDKVEELEEKIEELEKKIEPIAEPVAEPVGESIKSLNFSRYNPSVEVDPTKIN